MSIVEQKIHSELPKSIDYLLVCAGFEDRCLSMHQFLPSDRVVNVKLFSYLQFNEYNKKRKYLFTEKFNCTEFELDNSNPNTIVNALIDCFSDLNSFTYKPNIVIDISSFTRETILVFIKFININKQFFSEIILFYRKAHVSDTLSDGLINVRSVIGYMGDFDPSKPIHLIILSGFEYERAKGIIDVIEPAKISIGLGAISSSINNELFLKNKDFTYKLLAFYSDEDIFVFEHSLIDPIETKEALVDLVARYPDHNIVLAPLNNKISTVAAGLLAIENENIQLCYSQMGSYNLNAYSAPIDDCIIINLDDLLS